MGKGNMPVSKARDYALIVADRKLCADPKDGYYHFFKRAWHTVEKQPLVNNWHVKFICNLLQKEVERIAAGEPKDRDVIINIPPRTSKSSLTAIFLNAWAWTKYPWMKFITASYSGSLSQKHSIKTKLIIESPWYQNRWGHVYQLSSKKNTNSEYWTTEGGMRFASSVKGTLTGDGADILIGDDLLNPRQSESDAERAGAVNFWRETASSRLNDQSTGLFFLIQQRTHAADVVGAELLDNPEMYQEIVLPATDDYPISPSSLARFYQDGMLDPVRLSREILARLEKKMTNYAGQYGQKPKKPGGNILKPREWFFEYKLEELYRLARLHRQPLVWNFVVDGAYTKKKSNSATVCMAFTYFLNKWWIRAVLRDWMSFTECIEILPEFLYMNGYNPNSHVWIEPKANGLDLIDWLVVHKGINAMQGRAPTDDKIQAAHSATPTMKAGRVGILSDMPGKSNFYDELEDFPNGSHNDQVDCTVLMIEEGGTGDVLASG